ncbi:cytochrome b-c1 complex subunit 6 [Skeletonema marinoi]|uniref:Cytochrome b-c1 complex subunit 6 n=1 Tax=Skeletonema marinoi TaxID=267567 RepID=A0AAD9DI83_9STRA|nr:cytochrome b-c1 complex subunit 6 [Skeletonema marinoi]
MLFDSVGFLRGGEGRAFASEEEIVDHLPALKEACAKHCPAQNKAYEDCKGRIAKLGEGDCEAWYFDVLHCVDHCVAPQAFKKLK